MKKYLKFLPVVALLAGVFGVAMNSGDTTKAEGAWDNETVRIYLDKTTTIAGLGWWATDSTYINFTSDGTNYTYSLMVKDNVNLFHYDVPAADWNAITDLNKGKMEFHVHDWSAQQNIVADTDLKWLKDNELNLFKLNSANADAKQSYVIQNKEVEDTISAILALTCASDGPAVQTVVNQYQALRPLGKTNLNTWEVDAGVTWYARLKMYADSVSVSISPSIQLTMSEQKRNLGLLTAIGLLGVTALAGFYFISKKKVRA